MAIFASVSSCSEPEYKVKFSTTGGQKFKHTEKSLMTDVEMVANIADGILTTVALICTIILAKHGNAAWKILGSATFIYYALVIVILAYKQGLASGYNSHSLAHKVAVQV